MMINVTSKEKYVAEIERFYKRKDFSDIQHFYNEQLCILAEHFTPQSQPIPNTSPQNHHEQTIDRPN